MGIMRNAESALRSAAGSVTLRSRLATAARSTPLFLAATSALILVPQALADQSSWTSTTSNSWTVAGNWSPSGIPNSTSTTAEFGNKALIPNVVYIDDYSVTVGGLNFDATTKNWTITTNTSKALTLSTGGSAAPAVNVSSSLRTAELLIGIQGTNGFEKTGAGTLNLHASNTFSGLMTITGGTVVANALYAFYTSGNTAVVDISAKTGTTLDVQVNNNVRDLTLAGALVKGGSNTSLGVQSSITSSGESNVTVPYLLIDAPGGTVSATVTGDLYLASSTTNTESNTVGLQKLGDGTMWLLADNYHRGATQVSAGTLVVDGTTVAASAVTVAGGATLAGTGDGTDTGYVKGTVEVSGTISPGDNLGDIGTLTTGSQTWTADGHYAVDVQGLPAALGENNDLLVVNGTVTTPASGTFNIDFTNTGALTLNEGGDFDGLTTNTLYDWVIATVTSGGFDINHLNLNVTGFGTKGVDYLGDFFLTTRFNSNQLMVEYNYNAVPEATTLLFGIVGLAPMLLARRRSRMAANPRPAALAC